MKQLESVIEPRSRVETSGKQEIPVLDEKDRDQDQHPFYDDSLDPAEGEMHRILSRVCQEGAVQHRTGKNKEEIDGEVSTLENGNNVVEMPDYDDADEQEAEKLYACIPGSSGIHEIRVK